MKACSVCQDALMMVLMQLQNASASCIFGLRRCCISAEARSADLSRPTGQVPLQHQVLQHCFHVLAMLLMFFLHDSRQHRHCQLGQQASEAADAQVVCCW